MRFLPLVGMTVLPYGEVGSRMRQSRILLPRHPSNGNRHFERSEKSLNPKVNVIPKATQEEDHRASNLYK